MPEISRFYGIVIKMFFKPKEHDPSHIHALYGEYVGIFDLQKIEICVWYHNPDSGDQNIPYAELEIGEWNAENVNKLIQIMKEN